MGLTFCLQRASVQGEAEGTRHIGDTVPVVMRTYAHLYPNKQQELVSKLEAIGSPSSNDDESDLMSLG